MSTPKTPVEFSEQTKSQSIKQLVNEAEQNPGQDTAAELAMLIVACP